MSILSELWGDLVSLLFPARCAVCGSPLVRGERTVCTLCRERARNVEKAFAVRRPERLAGRHVLLVDDVMTTGSTLLSCAAEILRAAPGCRVSIAALAVPRRELGLRE